MNIYLFQIQAQQFQKIHQFMICDRLHSKFKGGMVILILRNQKIISEAFILKGCSWNLYKL